MQLLVTGCAGFVGSCFCEYVLAHYPEVTVIGIDNLCTGFSQNIDRRIQAYELDLVDHEAVIKVFEQHEIDYIAHFAAFAAEGLSNFCRRHTYMQNIIASTNLINCAINFGIKRFLFTSSIASYGELQPPFREDMIQNPCDIYGLSKFVTEQDLKIANEHHGLEYVVLRPFNVYGPKQALNSRYRNVNGIFMNRLLCDSSLQIYGDGNQSRAFSYIDDLLPPFWKALTDGICANQTYNVGASKHYTVKELANTLIRIAGKGHIEHLECRNEVKQAWCDVSKAQIELGLENKTDLESGLRKMWEWAQNQPCPPTNVFDGIEVWKGMYSFWKD